MPVLELEDGRHLAESNAILWYLADGTAYLPDRPLRARAGPAVDVLRAVRARAQHRRRPLLDSILGDARAIPGRTRQAGTSAATARSTRWSSHLAEREFFVGDRYSIADISLYAYTHVADEGGFDLSGYPAISAWLARVAAEPGHITIDD